MAQKENTKVTPSNIQDVPKFDVRIQSLHMNSDLLAVASVNVYGDFAVRGIKVMNGENGMFVSMPRYQAGNGKYKDICFPNTTEAREEFDKAVMTAYFQQLSMGQNAAELPDRAMGGMDGI